MKKKLPKSKRPTHFLRHKKSSPLSPISLKKTPKRKLRNNLKKTIRALFASSAVFAVSLLGLWIFFHHSSEIISPVPLMSNVLGTSTQANPSTLIAQYKEELNKKNIPYTSIVMQNGDIMVTLADDMQVLFSTNKDISVQIDSLQVTMDNLTIEGKRISRVDMRFERPVVTFK